MFLIVFPFKVQGRAYSLLPIPYYTCFYLFPTCLFGWLLPLAPLVLVPGVP